MLVIDATDAPVHRARKGTASTATTTKSGWLGRVAVCAREICAVKV